MLLRSTTVENEGIYNIGISYNNCKNPGGELLTGEGASEVIVYTSDFLDPLEAKTSLPQNKDAR